MSEEIEVKKKKKRWSTDRIMSTSALTITIISLIALFYQLSLAREENELIRKQQSASVLPYLSQWSSNIHEGYKIVFGNKGVGPAFIKKVTITTKDSIFHNTDHVVNYILKDIYTKDSIAISATTSTFSEGYVLPANETIEIVTIKDPINRNLFKKFLNTFGFKYEIIYSDVYGSEWSIKSSSDGKSYPIPKK